MKGKINSPPLLGRTALFELGLLDIRPDGSLKETNELRRTDALAIKSVVDSKVNSEVEKILKQHDKVFNGIGKIFDVTNNEDFLVKLSMKPDAAPVAQKTRPVPYYLQEPRENGWMSVSKKTFLRKSNQVIQLHGVLL